MSEYTRYLLFSAGIEATEQDIETIEASGHPYEVVRLLAQEKYRDTSLESIARSFKLAMQIAKEYEP